MNAVQPLLKVLRSRKMVALLLLGFASGLPLFLTSRTLQAWMKDEQVDLGVIGWFSLIGLPYTLKFLWSPFLDRFVPPFLGRRRGWLLITQIGLLLAIAAMSLQQPKQALQLLAINAVVIAFLSATQDIANDAYRTDVLEPAELGIGASTWVLGYRVAILVSGSLALILADYLSWQLVYLLIAGLMAIGIVTTLWAPEPSDRSSPPQTIADAIYLPFKEFFDRLGFKSAILVLLFVLFYKLGDALVGNMATPFLLDIGYSKTEIGAIQGTFGFLATTLGVVGGGIFLTRIGINRALWVFGGLQALSNFGYFSLTLLPKGTQWLLVAITLENFCAGLVTAAFVAYLMSQCNHAFTATQYALLSSLMASSNIILAAPAGDLAKATGWSVFFLLTLLASLPGLLLLPLVVSWTAIVPTQLPNNDENIF
ncbi:AmpG family muropeptide MFS transporter [Phormidium sp. CLA17]|uniref:AmpG family muropeptide MFS transporter n=1 Tax=Leptolyngbya sp. Cla-17 TaxID=2803751 RepID=UPI001492D083|nr:AmpG family muropeptide MFS transporter [Leptolyngbya sp. Cla-17]MBM0743915.1 AmpG family muropeptide MFS transporter [Leptolyngbya sp. Cla-17]